MGKSWYVSPQGTRQGDGTAAAPWSLKHALEGAPDSAGDKQVKPGDTVLLRHGIYRSELENVATVSGTAAEPITFAAYPNEVPLIDGSMPEFEGDAWERMDGLPPGVNLYRSKKTFPNVGNSWFGGFIRVEGELHTLAVHKDLASLRSQFHVYKKDEPYYLGPGLAWDPTDKRLYVRLDDSTPEAQRDRPHVTQIGDPDPRHHTMHIGLASRWGLRVRGSNLRFVGLHFRAHGECWEVDASQGPTADLWFVDCVGEPLRIGARLGRATNVRILGGTYDGHMHSETWWVSANDIKDPPREPAGRVRKLAFDLGSASNVELGPSPSGDRMIVRQFFDGILGDGPLRDVEVHGIWFDEMWDDSWQQYANISNVDYHDNVHFGAGPSRDGAGDKAPDGTVYIHDNVIDTTIHPMFWYRGGKEVDELAVAECIPFSGHEARTRNEPAIPWKLYHNTVYTGVNAQPKPVGIGQFGSNPDTSQPSHEVYNNIFVVLDGRPLDIHFWATSGLEIYDGNCLWSAGHWVKRNGAYRLVHTTTNPAGKPVRSVAEMQASQAHKDSQSYYPPGWDNSSIELDPALDESYVPTAPEARMGAVDLPEKWPAATGRRQRGAELTTPLPPRRPPRGSSRL